MLQDAGRSARAVAAYKTAFAHDDGFAEKVASTDVLTFASASSVNGFVALLGGKTRRAMRPVAGPSRASVPSSRAPPKKRVAGGRDRPSAYHRRIDRSALRALRS